MSLEVNYNIYICNTNKMLKVRFFNKQALHSISIISEYKSNISNDRQADEVKMMNIILYTN